MTEISVAVIGNMRHSFCSESVWARAFAKLGCAVTAMQVDEVARDPVAAMARLKHHTITTYTRTHSRGMFLDRSWSDRWRQLENGGTRVIGLHLDLFVGLERQSLIEDGDPQFSVGTLFSADGGHDDYWKNAGIRHVWFPPGVDAEGCELVGRPRPEWAYDVVFLGSGPQSYHASYRDVRADLIAHLRRTYGQRFAHIGHGGDIPVQREQDLADLLASCKVVAGDSCYANEPRSPRSTRYWSDRCPEVLGRSNHAVLVHPYVPGIREWFGGSELLLHAPGDWEDLDREIGWLLASPGECEGYVERGRRAVAERHTYDVRLRSVLETLGLPVGESATTVR